MRPRISLGWVLLAVAASGCGARAAAELGQRIEVEPLAAHRPPVNTEAGAGDTLESVCRRLAGPDWALWTAALSEQIDPRRLRPGTLFEGTADPHGRLQELEVSIDVRRELRLDRIGDRVAASWFERELEFEVVRLEGEITSSLFEAVTGCGGRPELAVELARIFQWDVDFFRDLRRGDRFVAVVEERRVEGGFYEYGPVFAARFVNRGRRLNAVAYPDDEGRLGYYDLEGQPLEKQFLRSPIEFSRITSRFSGNRFHPVLKRRMPHYGVDYGAPTGTPARVTADGVVSFVGRSGGAGNMVTVRHPNGYETSYLHLSRFGPGVGKGVRVRQGQVIGYVGATGWATGPHLDYRVKLNGRWINPLTISSPPAKPLDAERLGRYLQHAIAIGELLEGREPPAGARC